MMKNLLFLSSLLISATMAMAENTVYLTANGMTRSVTLNDNSATKALKELLREGEIKVIMNDYGGFEKVGDLPQSFPASDSRITTSPGDIMLYQGNKMVIFYGSNAWSYTPLGKIENATAEDVKEFLGQGTVEVTVSSDIATGIEEAEIDSDTDKTVYDLNGRIVRNRPLAPGLYIVNKKKVVVR